MSDPFTRAGDTRERFRDLAGYDATVINQQAETDANGDPVVDDHGLISWATPTETSTSVEFVERGSAQFAHRADGIETDVDGIAIVNGDITVTDGGDDEGTRATRIELDGETYVVHHTRTKAGGDTVARVELEE